MEDMDIDVDVDVDVVEDVGDGALYADVDEDGEGDINASESGGDDEDVDGGGSGEAVSVAEVLTGEEPKTEEIRKQQDRVCEARMTKYECVRVLGVRAQQLALGAPPCVPAPAEATPIEVAVLELEQGRTPLTVCRPLPCGKTECWRVGELIRSAADVPMIARSVVPYYQT